jgi:tetratricopeptide (TPR) repeat protein
MADFTSHEAAAHDAQSLPVMLPGKLIGRDATLAQVYAQLKANKPALIFGAAGIGKTALAARLASAYTELPGGVLWLNVDNSPLEELLVRVGRAYSVPEITGSDNPLAMIGAVANTLTQHKPLVVLDGELDEGVAEDFINRCAAGLPALIVSDEELEGPWTPIEVVKLEAAQAVALFNTLSGMPDEEGADTLVAKLGYSPFAIAVMAGVARAGKQPPMQLLQVLDQIPAAASPELLALTVSFRALNKALQGVILTLGAVFGGQASAELLSMISGAPEDTIEQVMKGLAQISLVERTQRYGLTYYRLHKITHEFSQTWLRGSQQLDTLQSKVRDAVMAFARKYSASDEAAHQKLAAEMETFLAVAKWSVEQGNRDIANQLVVALMQAGDFVSERGYLYELLQLRRLAASSTSAFPAYPPPVPTEDEEEDAPPVRAATPSLWDVVEDGDEEDEAEETANDWLDDDEEFDDEEEDEFEDEELDAGESSELDKLRATLGEARREGNKQRQLDILKQIGKAEVEQEMENEAITAYSEALTLYEELDDRPGILETLDMMAALMAKTENSQAAVLHATRGIALAKELNDVDTQMHLLMTLGDARQQLGESEEAVRAYEQALEVARTADDEQNEAMILLQLGYAQLDNGDPETAIETWEQALKLFREQNKRDREGRALGGLGTAYGELERWSEAINFHSSALHIAREVKDKEEEALQLGNLGYASVQANQLGQAVLRYRQALHLAYQSEDRDNIVSAIVDLVRLLVESKRHLTVAELLIEDALKLEPTDRDVNKLKERITNEKILAQANGVEMIAVSGSAEQYAANAYTLLDE